MVDLDQLTQKILKDVHYETVIEPKLKEEQSNSFKVLVWYLTAETYNEVLVKKALEVANKYDSHPMMLIADLWERIFAYNKGRPDLQWKVVESFDNDSVAKHLNSLKLEDKDWKYLTSMATGSMITKMVLCNSESSSAKNDYVLQKLDQTLFKIASWGGFAETKHLMAPAIKEWCRFAEFVKQY